MLTRTETLALAGPAIDGYVDLADALLAKARLHAQYPDVGPIRHLLSLYRQRHNPHFPGNERLELDRSSGFPVFKEITRAAIHHEAVRGRADAYGQEVGARPVAARFRLETKLRGLDGDTARVRVVLDRFDVTKHLFVRYTVLLRQTDARWKLLPVDIGEEHTGVTEGFRNTLSSYSSADAELVFLLLSKLPNLAVESVTRGVLGPLYVPGTQGPPALGPVLAVPGAAVLACALEVAGREVPGRASRDPLFLSLSEALDEESRAALASVADVPYGTHRELILVGTPPAIPGLKALAGGQAVVLTATPPGLAS